MRRMENIALQDNAGTTRPTYSRVARILSILGLSGSMIGIILLGSGHYQDAKDLAMLAAMPALFAVGFSNDQRSDARHQRHSIANILAFLFLAILIGNWWFQFDRIFDWPADLSRALGWVSLSTLLTVPVAYRVWWKRRLPG